MNKYNVFNLRTTFEDNFYVLEDSYGDEITLININHCCNVSNAFNRKVESSFSQFC